MKEDSKWKIPVSNFDRIALDDVKFIFSQANDKLKDTIDIEKNISTKTNILLSLIASIITILIGYIATQWSDIHNMTYKMEVSGISILYLAVVCGIMIRNILPSNYWVPGSSPKELFVEDFFDEQCRDKTTLFLYMNEIEQYEFRINENEHINRTRWVRYIISLISIILMPLLMGVLFIAISN